MLHRFKGFSRSVSVVWYICLVQKDLAAHR